MSAETYSWPYANEIGDEETVTSDVLVLGGGRAGCFAAIAAARKGNPWCWWKRGPWNEAVLQERVLTTGNQPVPTPVPG